MQLEDFLSLLRTYDFNKNSVNSFAKKYMVCPKTVVKHLRLNNISYKKRSIEYNLPRDRLGMYRLGGRVLQKPDEKVTQKSK